MKGHSVKLLVVVLTALAAIIWTAACVLDFVYDSSLFLKILRILCALVWVVAFLVNLYRYRKDKKEN